jgi:hypothetical protein
VEIRATVELEPDPDKLLVAKFFALYDRVGVVDPPTNERVNVLYNALKVNPSEPR